MQYFGYIGEISPKSFSRLHYLISPLLNIYCFISFLKDPVIDFLLPSLSIVSFLCRWHISSFIVHAGTREKRTSEREAELKLATGVLWVDESMREMEGICRCCFRIHGHGHPSQQLGEVPRWWLPPHCLCRPLNRHWFLQHLPLHFDNQGLDWILLVIHFIPHPLRRPEHGSFICLFFHNYPINVN